MNDIIVREDRDGYTILKAIGTPTADHIMSAINDYNKSRLYLKTIWDFSESTVQSVEIAKYRDIADTAKDNYGEGAGAGQKTALVFSSEHDEILGNAYEAFAAASDLAVSYRLFDSVDAAVLWFAEEEII